MSDQPAPANTETHPFHLGLLLFGGLCLGFGIVGLYDSFGWEGGGFNTNFELIGFHGLDDITILPMANVSIPLIVVGALCLIIANATAWRETGGY